MAHKVSVNRELRQSLAAWVGQQQEKYEAAGKTPQEVVPEMMVALLSLSAFIAGNGCTLTRAEFMELASRVAEDDIDERPMQ